MSWQAKGNDIVFLSFGLKQTEVERLLPTSIRLETRQHEGEEYGFLTLGLVTYQDFYFENFPLLSVDFPQAFLGVSILDSQDRSAFYIKRFFVPRFQSLFFRWIGGFPTRVMTMDYPTSAHPGGEYRWKLSNGGAGILRGKIERSSGATGRLQDLFEDTESMVDFFWNRSGIYAGSPESLKRSEITLPPPDPHPVVFEKMELGFLAEDLERHQFPEAVIGSFFVPEVDIRLTGPEQTEL